MPNILIRHLSGTKANQVEEVPLQGFREVLIGREANAHVRFDADREDLVSRNHARKELQAKLDDIGKRQNPEGSTAAGASAAAGSASSGNLAVLSPEQIHAANVRSVILIEATWKIMDIGNISPEAAQAQPVTGLSHLYSLGVVLFELITGRLPFESSRESELLRMQIQAPRLPLRSLVKDVPATVDEIVQRAMDRKASRRFRSAEDMAEALERCLEPASKRNTPTGLMRFFSLGERRRARGRRRQPRRSAGVRTSPPLATE